MRKSGREGGIVVFERRWLRERGVRLNDCRLVVVMNEGREVCAPPFLFKVFYDLRASVHLDD